MAGKKMKVEAQSQTIGETVLPNGARLSCAALQWFSQMQFYYDGRRQLQPLVRQQARTLTGCDRLPISCDSEVWPIRDDNKPIVLNFDFQARFEPSLYDQLERLVRVNIVLTTPRFEDNHGRVRTRIPDPMASFPFGRGSHGIAPNSKELFLPNGARLSYGAKRE